MSVATITTARGKFEGTRRVNAAGDVTIRIDGVTYAAPTWDACKAKVLEAHRHRGVNWRKATTHQAIWEAWDATDGEMRLGSAPVWVSADKNDLGQYAVSWLDPKLHPGETPNWSEADSAINAVRAECLVTFEEADDRLVREFSDRLQTVLEGISAIFSDFPHDEALEILRKGGTLEEIAAPGIAHRTAEKIAGS